MNAEENHTGTADEKVQAPEDSPEPEDIVFSDGMDEFDAVSGMISVLGNGISAMHEPGYCCLDGIRKTFDPDRGFGLDLRFYEGAQGDRMALQVHALGNIINLGRLCAYPVGGCVVAIPRLINITRLGLTPLDRFSVVVDGHVVVEYEEHVSVGFSDGIRSKFRKDYDTVAFRYDCDVVMKPSPEIQVYRRFGTNIIAADPGVRVGRHLILDDSVRWPNIRGRDGELAVPPEKEYPDGWEMLHSINDDPNGMKKIAMKIEYKRSMHPSYREPHVAANRLLGDVKIVYSKTGFYLRIPPYEKLDGEYVRLTLCYGKDEYPLNMSAVVRMGGCEHLTPQLVSLREINHSPLEGFAVKANDRVVFSTRNRSVLLFDRRGNQVDSLCGEGYVVSDHMHKMVAEGMRYMEYGFWTGCRISRVYIPREKAMEMTMAEFPGMTVIEPENRNWGFRHLKAKPQQGPAEDRTSGKPTEEKEPECIPKSEPEEIRTAEPMPPKDISDMDFGSFVEDTAFDRFESRMRSTLSGKIPEDGKPSHRLLMDPASLRLAEQGILLTFGGYECSKDEKLEILVEQGGNKVRVKGRPGRYEVGNRCITGLFDMCPEFMGLDPLGDMKVTVDGFTVADFPRKDHLCFDGNGRTVSDEGASQVWYRPDTVAVCNGKPLRYSVRDSLRFTEIRPEETFFVCPAEECVREPDVEDMLEPEPAVPGCSDERGDMRRSAIIGRPANEPAVSATVANNTVEIPRRKVWKEPPTIPHFPEGEVTMQLETGHILLDIPPYKGREGDNFMLEVRTENCSVQAGLLPWRQETNPPRTRSSKVDLTVLDICPVKPFSLLIDGKEVYSNRSYYLMFGSDGTRTGDREDMVTLIAGLEDRVDIECRGTFHREEMFGLQIYDVKGCEDVRFSVSHKRPAAEEKKGRRRKMPKPWFSMDGRKCLLNLLCRQGTAEGSGVSLRCGETTVNIGNPESDAETEETLFSFAPADFGICPLDQFTVLVDGKPVYETREQVMMMFDPEGKRTKFPTEDVSVVCRPSSRFDYKGCRVLDGEDTDILTIRKLHVEADSKFHVGAPNSGWERKLPEIRHGFDRHGPCIVYYDGDIVVNMPRYYGDRDAPMECWLEQGGTATDRIRLNRIDRPSGTETVPHMIPMMSAGLDPLGGFSLMLDGEVLYSEKPVSSMMFRDDGKRSFKTSGEALVLSRPGSVIRAPHSEFINETSEGDVVMTQIYVSYLDNVFVESPEPEAAEEGEATEEPEIRSEEETVPESEDGDDADNATEADEGEEPDDEDDGSPATETVAPARDVTKLSFEDFFGKKDETPYDAEESYNVSVKRRFSEHYPNLYFDMDHVALDITEYIGSHRDAFDCWITQEGTESEHFGLDSYSRDYDSITKPFRADLDALGIDPLKDFDLYIDGRRAYYYRSQNVLFFNNIGKRMTRPSGETLVVCPDKGTLDVKRADLLDEIIENGIHYMLFSVSYSGCIWYHPPKQEVPAEEPPGASEEGIADGTDDTDGKIPETAETVHNTEPEGTAAFVEPKAPEVRATETIDDADDACLVYSAFRFCVELPSYDGLWSDRFELSVDSGDKIFPLGRMETVTVNKTRKSIPTRIWLDELDISPFSSLEVTIDNKTVFSKPAEDVLLMDSEFRMVRTLAGYRNLIFRKGLKPEWENLVPIRLSVINNIVIMTVDAGPEATVTIPERTLRGKKFVFMDEKPDVFYRNGAFFLHIPPMKVYGEQPLELSIRQNGRTVPTCILGHRTSVTAPMDVNITDMGMSPLDTFEVIIDGVRMHINWESNHMIMDSEGRRTIKPEGTGYAVYRPSDRYCMFDIGVKGTRNVGTCVVSEISLTERSEFVPAWKIVDTISGEEGNEVCGDAAASVKLMDVPEDFEAYLGDDRIAVFSGYPYVEVHTTGCDPSDCRVRVVNDSGETVFGPVPVTEGRMCLTTYNARGPLTVQVVAGKRVLCSETYIRDTTFYYQIPLGHILSSEDMIRISIDGRVRSFSIYDRESVHARFHIQGCVISIEWNVPYVAIKDGRFNPYDEMIKDYDYVPTLVGIRTNPRLKCRFMVGNKEIGYTKANVTGGNGRYEFSCLRQEQAGLEKDGKYELYATLEGFAPLMILKFTYPGRGRKKK